jgi:hypothetical protein
VRAHARHLASVLDKRTSSPLPRSPYLSPSSSSLLSALYRRHGRGELELTSLLPLCSRRSVLPRVPLSAPPPPPSQILARAPLLAAPPPSQFAITGAASAVGSCARGQGATARLPAIRDHQRVRVGPLVLPRPSAVAGERPTAGFRELRRPLCSKFASRTAYKNLTQGRGLTAMS